MIDLHCHTTLSDGVLSPEDLVRAGAEAGIKVLAITDHDDCRAYMQSKDLADELDINLIPGAEISSFVHEIGVHILAYNFDVHHEGLTALLANQRAAKRAQVKDIIARLEQYGVVLDYETDVKGSRADDSYIGRPHIARAMVPRYVKQSSTVYRRYIGRSGVAYASANLAPAQEIIDMVHDAGGVTALAHPRYDDVSCTLPLLIEWGLDGIECHRPRCSRNLYEALVSAAHHNELFTTGGSDWHGDRPADRLSPFGSFSVEASKLQRFLYTIEPELGASA